MKLKPKFKNGQKVRCKISGFEGTIMCEAVYLNGCIRYLIQPELDRDGHFQESQVLDEDQLELIEDTKKEYKKKPGGDRPFQSKYKL